MKAEEFPQRTTVIAKDQPQYNPLPAHVANGVVTSCWRFTRGETEEMLQRCKDALEGDRACYPEVFVSQVTFGHPLQPLAVAMDFDPPKLSDVVTQAEPELKHKQVTDPHEIRKLRDIAELRGLSGPVLFAMDSESVPGKVICHFVRMETQVFADDENFDRSTLQVLHPESDKRLPYLADCFISGQRQAVVQLMQALSLAMSGLDLVLKLKGLPPQVRDFLVKTMRACAKATETHG